MAEILVERRRPGVWPWVLGLTVLAFAIWGLVEFLGTYDDAAEKVKQAPPTAPVGAVTYASSPLARPASARDVKIGDVPQEPFSDGRGLS